jgi:hypothetical protein
MTLLVAALLAASATAEIPKTGGTLPEETIVTFGSKVWPRVMAAVG